MRRLFTASILIFLMKVLSGCIAAEALAGGEGLVGASEFTAADGVLGGTETFSLETMFKSNTAGDIVVSDAPAVNNLLGRIKLERFPGEPAKLYIQGKSEPFAEVYPNSGNIKMLTDGSLHSIPANIFSVEGETVNIRSGTTSSSNIVAIVKRGDLVVKLAEENGWYQVKLAKNSIAYIGYIQAIYLAPLVYSVAKSGSNTMVTVNPNKQAFSECSGEYYPGETRLFFDKFLDNRFNWPVFGTGVRTNSITRDGYVMANRNRAVDLAIQRHSALLSGNYGVAVRTCHLNGFFAKGYGIVFNFKDENNYYVFWIASDGEYEVLRLNNGTYEAPIRWTSSDLLKRGDGQINYLGVYSCGNHCIFTINFSTVNAIEASPEGDGYGVAVSGQQTVAFQSINLFERQRK